MHFIFGLVMVGLGGFLIWKGLKARATKKLVTDTKTSQVGRLVPGLVEVKGRIRCEGAPLTSPMTRKPCVLFRFHVEEHRRSGSNKNSSWQTVINDVRAAGCVLSDGTGDVRLNLTEAELLLNPDTHAKSGTFNDAAGDIEATLAQYGQSSKGFIFNKAMRYTETVLEPGDAVYALGTASSHAAGGYQLSKSSSIFVVSDRTEAEVVKHFVRWELGGMFGGGLLAVAGLGVAAAPYLLRL